MTGILAVQGDFAEHRKMLESLGEECFEIRKSEDMDIEFDRLVLPGGESTVQGKLIDELGIKEALKNKINSGTPTLATCAGLILLAENIEDTKNPNKTNKGFIGTLPVTVKRNAYGRQLGSFFTTGEFKGIGTVPMEYIRAPYIKSVSDETEVKSVTDGNITAVRYKNQIAMSYHPELCDDLNIFKYFLEMI